MKAIPGDADFETTGNLASSFIELCVHSDDRASATWLCLAAHHGAAGYRLTFSGVAILSELLRCTPDATMV